LFKKQILDLRTISPPWPKTINPKRKLKGLYWVYTDEYRIVGAPCMDPESSIGQGEINEDT